MKNAILFHGSSGSPQAYWLPSIRRFLEKNGYHVWVPQLPVPEAPNLEIQLPFVLKNGTFTKETVLVAHSAGCPLALSVLEKINVRVSKAILVSGYARKFRKMKEPALRKLEIDAEPILAKRYDWARIKRHVDELIFINSDNDPWGCDDVQGRYMLKKLGGTLIVRRGEGHMGSDMFKQPYKEFPFLERLLH